MQTEINIQVGNRSPKEYFDIIKSQISRGEFHFGAITSEEELKANMAMNCIPVSIFLSEVDGYEQFLQERRSLMAQKMRAYYYSL